MFPQLWQDSGESIALSGFLDQPSPTGGPSTCVVPSWLKFQRAAIPQNLEGARVRVANSNLVSLQCFSSGLNYYKESKEQLYLYLKVPGEIHVIIW